MADTTNAQIGAGVVLSYWNTAVSPDVWATLGQIRSINGVGMAKTEVDSTTLESTAVERIGGLRDGKQASIVFTTGSANGNMDLIRGWVDGTASIDYRLEIPAPATETLYFTLVPLNYDLGNIEPSGLMEMTLMGRITGVITPTPSHP